jgi:myo-inositol-1(or 4)-monophosphatase
MINSASLEPRLKLAVRLAVKAGELLRSAYGQALAIKHKGSIDLVTDADLRAEALLLGEIQHAFPGDGFLAEEAGSQPGDGWVWYVDPLDGTTNFVHHFPVFSVSIAASLGDHAQLGVVYDPLRGELFQAFNSGGAWLNDKPIGVSPVDKLGDSLLATGFPYDIRQNQDNNLNSFAAVTLRAQGIRSTGSAALDLAYVACGRLDGYWELRLSAWDWAAGMLLVTEAGGRATCLDGSPDVSGEPAGLVATNGRIHNQLLATISGSA